jgi:trigger factor
MQVQVEDVGPCKKLLKVEVPAERVDAELEKTYEQLGDGVVVPGFRKGHAPRWLLQSKFGKQVCEDAKESLIAETFDEAVKEQELHPIGRPTFDEEITFEAGKPLAFGVTIEVQPEFEIEDYADLSLKKPSAEPSKAEIKERTDMVRRRYAKLKEVTAGSPKADDVVMCQIKLTEGKEVYRDIPNHQFILGGHVLIGMNEEETVKFVKAATIGETAETTITLPDTYPEEEKRGTEMTLALTIEKLQRPQLPKVTEKWVKEMGFDSVDEFNEEIHTALVREKERGSQQELQEQLDEQMLKKVDFDLPEDVVNGMAERTLVRRSLNLRYQGVPEEEVEKNLETLREESRESAERSAKLFFILSKIADKERIFVTEDEVNARIEAMAATENRAADQIARDLEQNDRLSELRSSMREEKVRSFLLDKAKIKEPKSPSKKAAKSDT